jgi:hypothetical protein
MKRAMLAAALAAVSVSIHAQSGPGPMGPRYNDAATPGWTMMTPEERKAHHDRMGTMKDPGECRKYMDEHYKQMQERAKTRSEKLAPQDAGHGCGHMMGSGSMMGSPK